jgi:hypothetical protein
MNYSRIYSEFIADRLAKQPVKPTYFERHHILPRSLGGSNGAENIIRLTPEDHLFAHLVLAKIHGGKMWIAVKAMENLANKETQRSASLRMRVRFGYIRKALSKHYREVLGGATGKIADKAIYTLHNFDGREVSGNRFDLEIATGVTRQQISAVIRGAKKSAHGWYCKEHNPDGKTKSELLSECNRLNEKLTLYHFDGRVWSGSKWDFQKEFGKKLYFQSGNGDCAGWHRCIEDADGYTSRILAKTKHAADSRHGINGARNPNADKQIYKFVVLASGQIVEGTKWDIKQRFGVTSSGLCSLFNGRQKKTHGLSLSDTVRASTTVKKMEGTPA